MGNWHISIEGVGSHHNGKQKIDADAAFVEFVDKLKADGHSITHSSFTYGGSQGHSDARELHKHLAKEKGQATSL